MKSAVKFGKGGTAGFRSTSIVALALAAMMPAIASAQDADVAESPDQGDAGTPSEDIVVTGSRIAGQALTAPNPISQVSSEEFTLSSSATAENLLNTLPQVVPGESGFTNNESSGAATVDLRGLGPQRNLILVDGRRYIFYDAQQVTDLNTIPTGLVERVELITGGSSAVYGSDAVSGVVNFILKKDFEGLEISAQHDVTAHADANKTNLDVIFGGNFAEGRGNATVYFNYFKRNPLKADARKRSECFLEDTVIAGVPALACGGSSGIPNGRISGIPTGAALANMPDVAAALANLGLSDLDGNGFKFDDTGQNVSRFIAPGDRFNFNPDNYLQLPQERRIIGGMAHYEVTPDIEAYFDGIWTNNQVRTKRAATPVGGSYPIQVDSPFLTAGLQDLFRALDAAETGAGRGDGYATVSINRRINEGGTRDVTFERNAYRFVGGFKGKLGDLSENFLTNLSWDAYYSYARTRNVQVSEGNILSDAFTQGVTTAFDGNGNLICRNPANGCVPLNIFGPNISPEGLDFITGRTTSSEEAEMQVASGVITGNLFNLPAGPLGFAFGAEWRDVSAFFIPSQGGVGDIGEISGGGYNVSEIFGEVRVPVLDGLEVNGAFRYSDYSLDNVNGVWTYGGGVTWQVIPELMLRGQYQRAVRAPSVDELFASQSRTSAAATDPCSLPSAATNAVIRDLCVANGVPASIVGTTGVQPNFQLSGIVGGNPDLEEETTDTYTLGAVLRPMSRMSLTVDYYNITIKDAISVLGGSINNVLDLCFNQVQDITSPYCTAVVRAPDGTISDPGGVSVLNANVGQFKTDGIDASFNVGFDVGDIFGQASTLSLSTAVSWLNNFDRTPVAALPDQVNHCAGAFGLTCGEPLPEWKATGRLTLNAGDLTASLRWRYIGASTDDRVTRGLSTAEQLAVPRIKPENYFDVTFAYDFGKFELTSGVVNMFDNHQQMIGSSQEQLNTFPSTYDPLGIRFFIGAKMKL